MGRERLKGELLAKGVAEAVAQQAIDSECREVDEDALARQALRRQYPKGRRPVPRRAAAFLRQRGFDEETIGRIIERSTESKGCDS